MNQGASADHYEQPTITATLLLHTPQTTLKNIFQYTDQ
jgi:hypothetical protein